MSVLLIIFITFGDLVQKLEVETDTMRHCEIMGEMTQKAVALQTGNRATVYYDCIAPVERKDV